MGRAERSKERGREKNPRTTNENDTYGEDSSNNKSITAVLKDVRLVVWVPTGGTDRFAHGGRQDGLGRHGVRVALELFRGEARVQLPRNPIWLMQLLFVYSLDAHRRLCRSARSVAAMPTAEEDKRGESTKCETLHSFFSACLAKTEHQGRALRESSVRC